MYSTAKFHGEEYEADPITGALQGAHLKASSGRIAVLRALEKMKEPVSAEALAQKLAKKTDRATIFRSLETLTEAGLVHKVQLGRAHDLYEIAFGRKHHHHAVCTSCGLIEDIHACDSYKLDQSALKKLENFPSLSGHSLEFFGLCIKCGTMDTDR